MAVSPEFHLISSIIVHGEYKVALAHGISNEMFHVCREEFDWISRYFGKHKKTPSRAAFRMVYPSFTFKDVNDTGHFVEEVRKSHARALMTELMKDQADLIAEGKITEAAELGMSGMVSVASKMGEHSEVDLVNDWMPHFRQIRARKVSYDENGISGIPTGFETLDARMGGIGRGQSWILGARLGVGKSWKLIEVATAALIGGYRVHFAALEMSNAEVAMRVHNLLSSSHGQQVFQATQLAMGRDYDINAYRKFLEDLPKKVKGTLTTSDARNIGEMEVAAQIERNQPDLYILDYLTLGKMRGDGGWQDISKFSKDLKIIGGRYQCGMLSAAQLNRQGSDRNAGAETIGGSDAIGQDADAVIILRSMSQRVTEMKVEKWRHGRSGYKVFSFLDLETGQRHELTKAQAEDIRDQDLARMEREEQEAENGTVRNMPRKLTSVKREVAESTTKIRSIQGESTQAAYALPQGAGRGMRRKS